MKIGIFYDNLISKGGAERTIIEFAKGLNADIITSGYRNDVKEWIPKKLKVIDIGNISFRFNKTISYLFETPLRFYLNREKFNYDIYIFSGRSSIFASNKNNKNFLYCHTPDRILYDLDKTKRKIYEIFIVFFYKIIFKKRDQIIIKNNFSKIFANSRNVKKRIKKIYNLDSEIIYPPVIKNKKSRKIGDYFLSVGRLHKLKRFDLIISAFNKEKNKKLIIVGDGPEKNNLKNMINGNNIKILSNVNEEILSNLYSNCLATIYMPKNEDFGLVPVEGMIYGKGCIAVNEGGCMETVINKKTGLLINANEFELIDSLKKYDYNFAKKISKNCIKNSKKFDIEECIKKWKKTLNEN